MATDIKRVQELLRLMEEHGLAEIEVESKGLKVRLRKEKQGAPDDSNAPGVASAPLAAPGVGAPEAGAAPGAEETDAYPITSPIVGTFYLAPDPDAEHFVEVGDPVEADTVVCIVEAMKVMNEVKAEVSGSILKVLVGNGTAVEYGQPLFLVSKQ
jgi:acetyl-CoA carboxylase biotin carboxyl carrier protein